MDLAKAEGVRLVRSGRLGSTLSHFLVALVAAAALTSPEVALQGEGLSLVDAGGLSSAPEVTVAESSQRPGSCDASAAESEPWPLSLKLPGLGLTRERPEVGLAIGEYLVGVGGAAATVGIVSGVGGIALLAFAVSAGASGEGLVYAPIAGAWLSLLVGPVFSPVTSAIWISGLEKRRGHRPDLWPAILAGVGNNAILLASFCALGVRGSNLDGELLFTTALVAVLLTPMIQVAVMRLTRDDPQVGVQAAPLLLRGGGGLSLAARF